MVEGVVSLDAMQNRVPERLKSIIDDLKISQAEAARRIGISPSRLNNYMSEGPSGRTPDLDMLMQMARGLNTTTDYLLGFSAAEPPHVAAVVGRLLELEGLPPVRSEALAALVQECLKILASAPDDGDAETRSRTVAQTVWQLLGGPRPTQ